VKPDAGTGHHRHLRNRAVPALCACGPEQTGLASVVNYLGTPGPASGSDTMRLRRRRATLWKASLAAALILSSSAMTTAVALHHWRECHKAVHYSLDQRRTCHGFLD
jgi:hypothetical protein